MLVKDIRPALGSSDPKALTDIDGRLVFCACKRDSGCEVWTSDGTEAGTLEVAEIPRGNTSSSNPSQFVRSGSLIYFTADDGVHGRELWAIPLSALGEPVPTTPVKTATGTPTATRTITATPTATPTPMNTMTPVPTVTRTPTLPPTQAPTATRNSGGNSSGCTVTPGRGSNAWWLLVPALLVGTRVRHPCRTRR
jgi:ELWxxDGT repeat protein